MSDFHFQCPLELCHVATLFQIAKGYHFQVMDTLKYCQAALQCHVWTPQSLKLVYVHEL